MLVQRTRIVLREHRHLLHVGIRHVGEREVDGPEGARHRHRGDRPLVGQFFHPLIVAARKDNSYRSHILSSSLMIAPPLRSTASG